jgi:nicotinate-nucleotide adenylyltransferase
MGGTFDPIHLGHLRAAEMAREALGLGRVVFVPAGIPPHRGRPRTSALDRYAMVCLATQGHPQFSALDLELCDERTHYTVDTLSLLAREHAGVELVLIVGTDAFAEIASWRDPARLRALCRVGVVARPEGVPTAEMPPGDDWVHPVPGDGLPISATDIRRRLGAGLSIRYLVPEAVADHIEKRGLYRP